MMRVPALTVCLLLSVCLAGRSGPNARATQTASVETDASIPFELIARPKPGTWPTYHGNLSGNRYSPLDQINGSNVHQLAPRWMFTIHGTPRDPQVTPVVAGGGVDVTGRSVRDPLPPP